MEERENILKALREELSGVVNQVVFWYTQTTIAQWGSEEYIEAQKNWNHWCNRRKHIQARIDILERM